MANPNWAPGTFFHLHEEDPVEEYENFKLGMWIFLATEVLLFGGLFCAFFIFKYTWPEVFTWGSQQLKPALGATNTVVLLCSSFSMAMAVDSAQRGRKKLLILCLIVTLLFACGFLGIKYIEWSAKFEHGYHPGSSLFFAVYFMTTGLHLLHVLIGMTLIGILLVGAIKGRYHEEHFGGVEVGGLYWHIVDVIWIFLFPLLYLLNFG